MNCDWNSLLSIIPPWLRAETDRYGRDTLQELRLRIGRPPMLICKDRDYTISGVVRKEDLHHVINLASGYSPWNAWTMSSGYLTASGGHRIGICGQAVIKEGEMTTVKDPTSLCIRIARDIPGIADKLRDVGRSCLIIGRPGSGKTTLLRDLIRVRAATRNVSVVDERGELFPKGFDTGIRTDVLTGHRKREGILQLLKTMSPSIIAMDEITSPEDCDALLSAHRCGTDLLATAHAEQKEDLRKRSIYRPLMEEHIFDTLIILHADKSWELERM